MLQVRSRAIAVLAALALPVWAAPILDADSSRFAFQARITQGNAPVGQPVDLAFRLYDGAGQVLGSVVQVSNVDVAPGGLVSVMVPFDPALFDGTAREIGVSINNSPELTPRFEIGATPYAYRADRVTSEELDDFLVLGQGGRNITPVIGNLQIHGGATFPTINFNGAGSAAEFRGWNPNPSGPDSLLTGRAYIGGTDQGGLVTTSLGSATQAVMWGEGGTVWARSALNVGPMGEELITSAPYAALQFGSSFGGRMVAYDVSRVLTTVIGSTGASQRGGLLQLYRGGNGLSSGLTVELAGDDTNGGGYGLWRDSTSDTTVRISGEDHRLYTYGADDAEHARIGGAGSGNIQLRGGGVNNAMTVNINSGAGGEIDLLDTGGDDFGLRMTGGTSSTPGRIRVYDDGSNNTIDLLGEEGESSAGSLTLRSGAQDRISLFAEFPRMSLFSSAGVETLRFFGNSSGGGGGVSCRNDAGTVTIELDGDETAGDSGVIRVRRGDGELAFGLNGNTRTLTARGGRAQFQNDSGQNTVEIEGDENNGGAIRLRRPNGNIGFVVDVVEEAGTELWLYNGNGVQTIQLDTDWMGTGNSRVVTGELQITGGSDLSEQFDVKGAGEVGSAEAVGTVVCIDPDNPGKLVVCSSAYDRTVAGIISGAGGVSTGMYMAQTGTEADGGHPVALTGRVYCKVDASNGAIRPGDLLTTSARSGYAMKVTDHDRAYGATIGKAMSTLDGGGGLVLVLVNLH